MALSFMILFSRHLYHHCISVIRRHLRFLIRLFSKLGPVFTEIVGAIKVSRDKLCPKDSLKTGTEENP